MAVDTTSRAPDRSPVLWAPLSLHQGEPRGPAQPVESTYRWLPHVLLLASLLIAVATFVSEGHQTGELVAVCCLSAAASLWTLLLQPRDLGSGRRTVAYTAGRIAFAAALVGLSPWFGIYAWYGYPESIRFFPGRRVYAVLAVTVWIPSASYLGGYPTDPALVALWIVLAVASWFLVSFFAGAAQRSEARDVDRESTLSQLTAALEENRALQEQLVAEARRSGAMEERARLAREIHDTLAQALTGIIRQLDAAERTGDHAHTEQAAALARDGLAEARRSLHALRPEALVLAGLPGAVRETAERWSRRTGVPCAVAVDGEPGPLGTDEEVALLRVAQEALANIEKHAAAAHVRVTLSYLGDAVLLDVLDDGVGFAPAAVAPCAGEGVGLAAMCERLAAVGGGLVIESAPGDGTAVAARLPLGATA